ncbi:hypothetical protein ACI3KS_11530 [Microbacterium sp. ZW T5_45]|uniref:hypothetical protein n=1 Tax=Microbacterium sp. ZW T5_45 TaxID=3378080 RepID=UPI0038554122
MLSTPESAALTMSVQTFMDSPFFVGVLTLAGVALGAWLSYVFNRRHEDRKAAREDAQRWDQNVLNHTSAVITLTRQLRSAASDYFGAEQVQLDILLDQQLRGEAIDAPTIAQPALRIFSDTFDAFTQECDQLALVAPTSVREAVQSHWEFAAALMRANPAEDTFTPAHDLASSADVLATSVRQYFGIESIDQR